MEAVLRGIAIYVFLMVVLRFAGRRTFSEMTTFDFVLLLVISEATQQGMLGEDFSLTNAFIVITTLVFVDVVFAWINIRWPGFEQMINGVPLIIVENGRPLKNRMLKARVDESDILEKARSLHGLERMDQIKYAVLERNGGISIIPFRE